MKMKQDNALRSILKAVERQVLNMARVPLPEP